MKIVEKSYWKFF